MIDALNWWVVAGAAAGMFMAGWFCGYIYGIGASAGGKEKP